MYGRKDANIGGFQFYDENGIKILEAGSIEQLQSEFELNEGERLIGIKAKSNEDKNTTYKKDIQFIIGWLE